jgi:hypothetical protein
MDGNLPRLQKSSQSVISSPVVTCGPLVSTYEIRLRACEEPTGKEPTSPTSHRGTKARTRRGGFGNHGPHRRKRIFIEGEIAKSLGDEAAVEALRRQLASEVATLEEKRELKKEKVRSAKKSA